MRILLHSIIFLLLVARTGNAADDFSIVVNSVGIGNNWRAGDITPVHVTVTSNKSEPIAAWVQWEVPDADGDTVLWGRPITLAPMRGTSTWLYAPTRGWDLPSTVWTIRLRTLKDDGPAEELEVFQYSPQSVGAIAIGSRLESFAIVGTRRLGLSNYMPTTPEVKQESARIVSGLTAVDLPDAWPCYTSLSALIWANAKPVFTYRQTEALQDWVTRGGHFILSLPTIGDPWAFGLPNAPLAQLTDGIQTSLKQVPVSALHSILGRNNNWPLIDVPIRVFGHIQDDWSNGISPLLWLQDGTVVAIQKTVGFGSVTIIGIDLTNGQLASLGLPETDVLWNRILGKRTDTPTQFTIQQLKDANKLSSNHPTVAVLPAGKMIAQKIAQKESASEKLGMAFLIILAYWIIGCPLGYFLLLKRKKLQWSWVFFVVSSAAFTAGTWIIATSTSGVPVPLKHLSVIDHVYGGDGQLVTGWFSLFLPNFGETNIAIQGEKNNYLFPWTPPAASMTPDFIDRREIVVRLDRVPHTFDQPARATTANFGFNWIGGINNQFYKTLIRVESNNPPRVEEISSDVNPIQLRGSIINNATKDLRDVTIIWVTKEQLEIPPFDTNDAVDVSPTWISANHSGQALQQAFAWRVPKWKSNSNLQLKDLYESNRTMFTNAVDNRYKLKSGFTSNINWEQTVEMLSLYSHLTPPVYQKRANSKQSPESHHVIREGGRELDFAEWFSRPCIIVLGFLDNAPIPIPVTSNGNIISSSEGGTIVRWVYPLEQSQ